MRRFVVAVLVGAAVVLGGGAAPAGAVGAVGLPTVDGFRLGHVPRGLGTSTDFAYEYDDVAFVSRVWESRSGSGWRVDMSVDVLRGNPLSTPARTHDWVIGYEERPAAEAVYRRTSVRGHAAWIARDEMFWSVRPGVAVIVRLDTTRWPQCELRRTAVSIRDD